MRVDLEAVIVQSNRRERSFTKLAIAASVLAASCTVYAASFAGANGALSRHVLDVVILALIAVIADEMAVEVRDRVTVTAGTLPILLAVMFLGQIPAMSVAAVVGLWGAWRESSRAIVVYNCSNLVISAFVAAEAFALMQKQLAIPLGAISLSLLLAGATGGPLATYWRDDMPSQLRSSAVVVGMGLAVAALYATAVIIAVVLLFIPLFA